MNIITNCRNTVRMAVEDTKFVNIMHLYQWNVPTGLITCPEVKLNLALELLKKMPFHVLLGETDFRTAFSVTCFAITTEL